MHIFVTLELSVVNILVKYLKINDLEELTREGDSVKIFG